MKKLISIVMLVMMMTVVLSGCQGGGKQESSGASKEETVSVKPADYFAQIWGMFKDEEKFPVAGGDFDKANMEGPDAFDVEKNKDSFTATYLVNDEIMAELTGDVVTLQHMMNVNTFCAAMFTVKDASKVEALAESYKKTVQANHWTCGMPDTVVVLSVNDLMIISYGADDIVQDFKTKCTSAETAAKLLVEGPAEG